jgi:hypothetical protein
MPKDARRAKLGSRNLPCAKLEPTSIHSSPSTIATPMLGAG